SINDIDTNRKMRTAYITFGSDLIGKSMTQCDFEQKNDVVLVAVARQGQRVDGQPREITLQAGDTLLLECPAKGESQLETNNRRSLTFFDSHFVPEIGSKTITSAAILLLMFIFSSFHVMPLMATTMLAAGLMLAFKCCRFDSVVKYIEWDILLILGATVVFSTAITKTGISDALAHNIIDIFGSNPYIILAVMCLIASVVSEFVSDVGAAAIFFPVMYGQAEMLGCNPMPFVMSLMLCVTFSYSSPIGSIQNMLVFGPGSFRFSDFARVGVWLHIVLLVAMLAVVNIMYPMYI
ncbi:MAG: anion permease, partial [Salinivirgaceae bacterium]|nr:anion permease [Salinivirgaceae bacterium]